MTVQLGLPERNQPTADSPRPRAGRFRVPRTGPLPLAAYLAASVALNWRLLAAVRTVTPPGDPSAADNDQFAWYMRYAAHAVTRGHLPALVTTALNAPRGVNLMWNTAFLLPGVVLSPVTAWLGPQASLDAVLVLGYAGSAAAMYWLLRRNRASAGAAALGGAAYGFCPALTDSAISHYDLQFAVLTPLIIEAALRILSGRGRPWLAGGWLGLLVSAQVFIEEETLADLVLACVVLVVVLVVSRPRLAAERLAGTAAGLGVTAAVTLAACGRALWVQFLGPLASHGSPYPSTRFGNSLASFVTAPGTVLFHTASGAGYAARYPTGLAEYLAYLGWPLLVTLVAAGLYCWGDLRVRCAFAVWAVLEVLSLGGHGDLSPFHWLQNVPLLTEMLPDRLSIYADGAAALALAFALDHVRTARLPRTAGPALRAVPWAVAMLAVLPMVPLPAATAPAAQPPKGWSTVYSRLGAGPEARVLVVPVPYAHAPDAMRWQAESGRPGQLVAGWFLGVNAHGQAVTRYWGPPPAGQAVLCLDALARGAAAPGCATAVRGALSYWRPDAVVADTPDGSPAGRLLTGILGRPAARAGTMLGWRYLPRSRSHSGD